MFEPRCFVAFYKGRRKIKDSKSLFFVLFDFIVRLFTRSKFSHVEIAILRSDGLFDCYSSSLRDGGVRHKVMGLHNEKWELREISLIYINRVVHLFIQTSGKRYDTLGVLRFIFGFLKQSNNKWFCSEWCVVALGISVKSPSRCSPQSLYEIVNKLNLMEFKEWVLIDDFKES